MSTIASIVPRTTISGANHSAYQISANPWNQPRIITGGTTGGLFVRDGAQADGWGLIDAVAAGQVLISAGAGVVPTWSSTVTLTNLTVTNLTTSSAINAPNGTFTTSISIGTTPATTGAIRLANNQGIYARDSANTVDIPLILLDSGNSIQIGNSSVTQSGIVATGSNASIGIGPVGAYTWTVTSSGHLVPSSTNAFDIGDTTHRVRNIWLAGTVTANDLLVSSGVIQTPSGTSMSIRTPGTASIFFQTNEIGRAHV